jgi:hypothetical protein
VVTAISLDGQSTKSLTYTVGFPSDHLVTRPHLKPHADGRFVVVVKVPGSGRVDIPGHRLERQPGARGQATQSGTGPVRVRPRLSHRIKATILRILARPNGEGRMLVKHHRYRVTLRLWVTYTPTNGRPRNIGYYGLHLP